MNKTLGAMALLATLSFAPAAAAKEVTAQIQMVNYDGHEAYLAVYLVNAEGRYETTLWVSGKDPKYHSYLPRWWRYLSRAPQELDAITGASAGGGDRVALKLDLKDEWFNADYAIRVESAVEAGAAHEEDVLFDLKDTNNGERIDGTGYVRVMRAGWE
ncbi:MAG: Tat pathway signal protein [Devosia sp.]|uniref:DUF2271 domain-containing protein n=1 Tax=Devosia sp. TaxID=1871048 RepID=UPI00260BB086|nr:DUF2271 domain-containing protein [Devosia sp.]MDB5528443.1 Tat pathway signal protein [Devosia sp.]